MNLQNYQHHTPSADEPWWEGMTPAHPHYDRALQLSQFLAAVEHGPTTLMRPRRLAYRARCVAHWQHYLAHGAPPTDA